MSRRFRKTITISSFVFLSIIFVVALIVVVFTFSKPQSVIDLLEPLVPTTTPAPIKMKGIAVLGDSQSDEYRADDNRGSNYPATTMNWVELLAKDRNVNFGPWGVWGEPRRTGYAYNWARTGNTTESMIESDHPAGIAQQIKDGKVNVVVIFIGANDFAPYITKDGYQAIYAGELSDTQKESKVNRVVANIKTAVYMLKAAGDVRILLVKVPDWGQHVGIQVAFPFPDQRNEVSQVIQEVNADLDTLAAEEDLETVDPNELYQELVYDQPDGKFKVDGVEIERLLLNNNPKNFYLEDGVHSGTVVNGFLANKIIEKLDPMITNKIKPFTPKEIREAAGL